MSETDYNARLYEKMKAEQDKYRDWLLHQEPSEILNHTYEYTMREDIVMYISGLLADLMNQKPVTAADFADLKGRILLILPDQDFFSGKMQQDLIALMHEPEIAYVSGGHLSTVVKAEDYIRTIRAILLPAGK